MITVTMSSTQKDYITRHNNTLWGLLNRKKVIYHKGSRWGTLVSHRTSEEDCVNGLRRLYTNVTEDQEMNITTIADFKEFIVVCCDLLNSCYEKEFLQWVEHMDTTTG